MKYRILSNLLFWNMSMYNPNELKNKEMVPIVW